MEEFEPPLPHPSHAEMQLRAELRAPIRREAPGKGAGGEGAGANPARVEQGSGSVSHPGCRKEQALLPSTSAGSAGLGAAPLLWGPQDIPS